MTACLIGLGANAGDRYRLLRRAVELLAREPRIGITALSRIVQTAPIGGPAPQRRFLNAVLRVDSTLPPQRLLRTLWSIEKRLGRKYSQRWAPRTVDLDLLLYDRRVIRTETLVLPHPRLAFRRFVLEPALDVAPKMLHPTTGWTVAQLLQRLDTGPNYVAITGPPGAAASEIAAQAARRCGAALISRPHEPPTSDDLAATLASDGRLLAERLAASGQRGAVSDFWFGEPLAWAVVQKPDVFPDAASLYQQQPQPKLVVLLHAPPDWLAERASRLSDDVPLNARQIDRYQTALRRLTMRPRLAPLLLLDARRPMLAIDEIAAAVAAMS